MTSRVSRVVPNLDESVRRRLRVRFGDDVEPWLDEAPTVLDTLAERWGLEFGELIPHGSMSVIVRCDTADGRSAVLKITPNRDRLEREAAALRSWATRHVPSVYEVDLAVGALLTEAIEPGVMLRDTSGYPSIESVAELMSSLQTPATPSAEFPPLSQFIAYIFDSTARLRRLHPGLIELVPEDLYERARRLAARLAAEHSRPVLLHGDLTPVNVLDGGERGLVAIDPAGCLGDPAYEAIDLLVWRAAGILTIEARAAVLAPAIGVDEARLLDWCVAFAGIFAIDLAGPGQRHDDNWRDQVDPLLRLASQAPR
jgi:streptomycin 6-kinase